MVSAGHSAGVRSSRDLRHELIAELYREGVPVAEITQRAGVCVKTVQDVARRAGLPSRNPSRPERDGEMAEARIFSRRIVEALARHGIVRGKTATLVLGPEASSRPAVWLGLFDGDGSVGLYRGGREPRVRFSGTRRLMQQCEALWRETLPYSGPAATPHRRGTWQFSLFGMKARAAADTLPRSSESSLARKRAILAEIAAWQPNEVL